MQQVKFLKKQRQIDRERQREDGEIIATETQRELKIAIGWGEQLIAEL